MTETELCDAVARFDHAIAVIADEPALQLPGTTAFLAAACYRRG